MKKKVYRVRTQYVFEGVFEVAATDREEAERKILDPSLTGKIIFHKFSRYFV